MSLVRLKHGNIGRKDRTCCVWQNSTLSTVLLPNLPAECRVVVIQRHETLGKVAVSLKSYQFTREKIVSALRLLKATRHEAWEAIDIDPARIDQWPEEGNLAEEISIKVPEKESTTMGTKEEAVADGLKRDEGDCVSYSLRPCLVWKPASSLTTPTKKTRQ